jgi:hypothetical protein
MDDADDDDDDADELEIISRASLGGFGSCAYILTHVTAS